jgi:hypothetical protein
VLEEVIRARDAQWLGASACRASPGEQDVHVGVFAQRRLSQSLAREVGRD